MPSEGFPSPEAESRPDTRRPVLATSVQHCLRMPAASSRAVTQLLSAVTRLPSETSHARFATAARVTRDTSEVSSEVTVRARPAVQASNWVGAAGLGRRPAGYRAAGFFGPDVLSLCLSAPRTPP